MFCSNCGMKHTFNYAKPNFCSGCGGSLGVVEKKKPVQQSTAADEEGDGDYEDDEDNIPTRVPKLSKIQVEIENNEQSTSFTLGSLFAENAAPVKTVRRNQPRMIEDFINEKPRSGDK